MLQFLVEYASLSHLFFERAIMSRALLSPDTLSDTAHTILKLAKKQGANEAEVGITNNIGRSIEVRLGEIETLEQHHDQGIGITVYFGKKKGHTSLSTLDTSALTEAVNAACHIAKYTQEDDCHGLANPSLMAHDYPDLQLNYPWNISIDEQIKLVKKLENLGLNYDSRISQSDGASLSTHENSLLYANTHGFSGHYLSSFYHISCTLIAGKGDKMQRDQGYSVARDPQDLDSIETIAKEAATDTLKRLNAKRLKTQQTPIIFYHSVAAGLIGHFLGAIRGSNLYRKASFLLNALGEPVFPEHIQILEDPYRIKALGSSPFDAEGVKPQTRHLIEKGRLKSYLLSTYTARKLGMETTGNAGGIHNILVSSEAYGLDDLLKQMGTGLLVTELMGQGINLLTGDYSRGASGFWVENGIIQYPVEEITIAGNLKNMLKGIIAISNDIETRNSIQTGSILIKEMTLAGE